MSIWRPQDARTLAEYFTKVCELWDKTPKSKRGGLINPDEPVVLSVPNPEWDGPGEAGPYGEDDEGEPTHVAFHVMCHGGGGDTDDDGTECGHDGIQLTGQEIDGREFLSNGRRLRLK